MTFKCNRLLTYVFAEALLLPQTVYKFYRIYPLCRCREWDELRTTYDLTSVPVSINTVLSDTRKIERISMTSRNLVTSVGSLVLFPSFNRNKNFYWLLFDISYLWLKVVEVSLCKMLWNSRASYYRIDCLEGRRNSLTLREVIYTYCGSSLCVCVCVCEWMNEWPNSLRTLIRTNCYPLYFSGSQTSYEHSICLCNRNVLFLKWQFYRYCILTLLLLLFIMTVVIALNLSHRICGQDSRAPFSLVHFRHNGLRLLFLH